MLLKSGVAVGAPVAVGGNSVGVIEGVGVVSSDATRQRIASVCIRGL